jgi:LPXTG-site transpeptidase (sortase) family protein
VSGTAQPGKTGNICLAGHRDTFFRPLKRIAPGDEVELRFPGGTTRYRVSTIETVEPTDRQVLEPTPDNTLTLITCYPFYFIGSAPKRFIVRASAISEAPAAAQEEPAALHRSLQLANPQGLLSLPERRYAWLLTDALNLLKVFAVALLLVKALRWTLPSSSTRRPLSLSRQRGA